MSSCGSNAGMETFAPLVDAIVTNAPFHSNSHQSDATSNHSNPTLFSGRLTAPDFVTKCIDVRAVWRPEIWKFENRSTFAEVMGKNQVSCFSLAYRVHKNVTQWTYQLDFAKCSTSNALDHYEVIHSHTLVLYQINWLFIYITGNHCPACNISKPPNLQTVVYLYRALHDAKPRFLYKLIA